MTGEVSVDALLTTSDELMTRVLPGSRGIWPRATAIILRCALEQCVDEYWTRTQPAMTHTSRWAQLLCLREFAGPDLAQRAEYLWASLSQACHYHTYELGPTSTELRRWHTELTTIIQALSP